MTNLERNYKIQYGFTTFRKEKSQLVDEIVLWTARRKYERQHLGNKKTKTLVDFDRLIELFGNDCLSFLKIAKELGVTKERVRQLYKQYFTRVFLNRPHGQARKKFCTLKTNVLKKQDFSSGVPQLLVKIAEIAKAHGYTCSKIPLRTKGRCIYFFCTSSLNINGKICRVHCLKNELRVLGKKNKYTRLSVRRSTVEKFDFLIIFRQIEANEHWFVIPATVVLNGWGTAKEHKMFFIRDKKISAYRNHYPKIDFWEYLDAWHLLQKQTAVQ